MSSIDMHSLRSRASSELCELRDENARLHEQLDIYEEQLMRPPYEDDQVPDANIRKDFERLCDSIEAWVDEAIYEDSLVTTESWNKRLRTEGKDEALEKLGLRASARSILIHHQYANVFVVSLVIWRFLERHIFDETYPIGTTKLESRTSNRSSSHAALLDGILHVLADADRERRGSKSRSVEWKAETLTAMTKSDYFRNRQERESAILLKYLQKELDPWTNATAMNRERLTVKIREEVINQLTVKLREDVVEPAISLHSAMACSKNEYKFIRPTAPLPSHSAQDLDFEQWTLKDITTWRPTTHQDVAFLLYLSPGLDKKRVFGESISSLELQKPVVVVYRQDGHTRMTSSMSRPASLISRPPMHRRPSPTSPWRNNGIKGSEVKKARGILGWMLRSREERSRERKGMHQ